MARPPSRHPTERELEILKLLWQTGPCSVRQVRDGLLRTAQHPPAYTSVMTVMSTMVEKRYLSRRREGNGYIYRASVKRSGITQSMLHDLIARAFDGSAANVALGLLRDSDLEPSQLQELNQLIDEKSAEAGWPDQLGQLARKGSEDR